jgi:predicted metal-dependent hydrolase
VTSDLLFRAAGRDVPLTIKVSPRAKTMRLRVDGRTGAVVLTIPVRASRRKALQWASGHRDWVETALSKLPETQAIMAGGFIPYLGMAHAVLWREGGSRRVAVEPGRLIVGGPLEALEARMLRWLRAQAGAILAAETSEFAAKAGVAISRVGVGDPVSRWGSCSSSGAIRYSWRLILAPEWVRRATVAHEVAHRVHMTHGPDFHALVEELLGADPTPARHWLRREGVALHRIGRVR